MFYVDGPFPAFRYYQTDTAWISHISALGSSGGENITLQSRQVTASLETAICEGAFGTSAKNCSSEHYHVHVGGIMCRTDNEQLPLRQSAATEASFPAHDLVDCTLPNDQSLQAGRHNITVSISQLAADRDSCPNMACLAMNMEKDMAGKPNTAKYHGHGLARIELGMPKSDNNDRDGAIGTLAKVATGQRRKWTGDV